ncbi:glycoside hydrolase family 32 protein [Microbacterium nanhaiense]|nr:glycoside hydrolase family 32 protein [Microbacterium nanhaiense]
MALGADTLRPTAHYTAEKTWLNDPNGLLHYRGVYHLFFQNNPNGRTWGDMSWGHATSTDLVTWEHQPTAISYTDDEFVFSGSAVVDVRNTAGFAQPGETALVAIYTSAATPDSGAQTQSQALAYSVDEGNTWVRYEGNPVLDIGSTEFRDPKVFWYGGEDDGHWVMVIVEATNHRVIVYTSNDLRAWTRASHFGPAHAVGGVWECPDLFPLRVEGTDETKWVLIVSLNPGGIAGGSGTQFFIGDFDGETFTAENLTDSAELEDYDWLDYGHDYYAAVSFNNAPDGRRLMIGWASNWLYARDTPVYPWRSAMSLVREVTLERRPDGAYAIAQRPILPESGIEVHRFTAPKGERAVATVSNSDGERVTITAGDGALVVDRSQAGENDFHPDYRPAAAAPLPEGDVDVTIVVDGPIIEVFADGGRVVMTEQVFPARALDRFEVS